MHAATSEGLLTHPNHSGAIEFTDDQGRPALRLGKCVLTAECIWRALSDDSDYHRALRSSNFMLWLLTRLAPTFHERFGYDARMVLVMDSEYLFYSTRVLVFVYMYKSASVSGIVLLIFTASGTQEFQGMLPNNNCTLLPFSDCSAHKPRLPPKRDVDKMSRLQVTGELRKLGVTKLEYGPAEKRKVAEQSVWDKPMKRGAGPTAKELRQELKRMWIEAGNYDCCPIDLVKEWEKRTGNVIMWTPPNRSVLNPIEYVWRHMKQYIYRVSDSLVPVQCFVAASVAI
jgi:transposase